MKYKKTGQKKQEVNKFMQDLENGVKDVFASGKYQEYLDFCSKFHNYSYGNIVLIMLQNPNASQVASFTTWNRLGFKIKKGAKALKILCPVKYNTIVEEDGEEVVKNHLYFKLGNVFDITQVEGDKPSLVTELKGNSDEIKSLINYALNNTEVAITIDKSLNEGSANGYYDVFMRDIHIKESLDDIHKLKTIIHELAHSILHCNLDDGIDRRTKEVQAESVAYIVCRGLGLNTDNYSFGYVASWSRDKELKELKDSLDIINKTSQKILNFFKNS